MAFRYWLDEHGLKALLIELVAYLIKMLFHYTICGLHLLLLYVGAFSLLFAWSKKDSLSINAFYLWLRVRHLA